MAVEIKKGEYPIELVERALRKYKVELDSTIEDVAETRHPELVKKIRDVCEPLMEEMITHYLGELHANRRGIWDAGVEAYTNATLVTVKVMDEHVERLEEFWKNNKQNLEKDGLSEDTYWKCIEWVPISHLGMLLKRHSI